MPIANLKLLVRPNPGGLEDHRRFLAEGARSWLAGRGDFSDFVISSEDGLKLSCHLSLLVPHSPLLRAIVPTTGYDSVYQLCLPVSGRTLRNMLELLYTGEISASRSEVEEIKTGLTLLGILSPSEPSCPPPPAQQPSSSLSVGIINSSQAKNAASAVSLSVSDSKPKPTVELFGPVAGQIEVSNELRLHRAGQKARGGEEAANNNVKNNNNNTRRQEEEENLNKESRAKRRRRIRSYCDDEEEEVEDVKEENIKTEDEIQLAGVAVTKEVECCQDCGASLPSEWHRPPNRHDCQAMSETVCQYCQVTVRGSWYLPPSRHHCPGSTTPRLSSRRKRRRIGTNTLSQTPANKKKDVNDFSCPLVDCSRQCDSKKLLMLHLAISHYREELEDLYINGVCSDGGRVCPDCGDIQPGIKLNFIRHIAMEHEVVMELVERDVFQASKDDDEDFNVNMA